MENDEIKHQIQDLVQNGHTRSGSSPCKSPIVLVQKKDGNWKIYIGYRALNKIIVRNQYPIPRIDELPNQLKGENFFSNIDLNYGYHQVPIEQTDVRKKTFKSKKGIFKWLVMPFVLTNPPSTFMRLMDNVLIPFTKYFVVVYLDDILIFNKTWEEHMQHIQQVLSTLWQYKLYSNSEKLSFGMNRVQYLGYIVDENGVHVDPANIQVIDDCPTLTTLTNIQIFL
jgi:hypothetical protein